MDIFENHEKHLNDFIRLNESWISEYFCLEESDHNLAKNPKSIIDDGGFIFSLVVDDSVVGVCALFNEGGGIYQLARMAVDSNHRGKGYGNILIEKALDKAKDLRAKQIFLLSNSVLEAAISLYKKYGFSVASEGEHPIYSRCNVVMVIDL